MCYSKGIFGGIACGDTKNHIFTYVGYVLKVLQKQSKTTIAELKELLTVPANKSICRQKDWSDRHFQIFGSPGFAKHWPPRSEEKIALKR